MRFIIFLVMLLCLAGVYAQECEYGECDELNEFLERDVCIKRGSKFFIADEKCSSYGCKVFIQKQVVKCCDDGDCKAGKRCVDNFCVEGCEEGSVECSDGNVIMCVDDEYKIVQECGQGCIDGQCVKEKERGLSLIWKFVIGGFLIPVVLILIVLIGWLVNKIVPEESTKYKRRCVRCDAKIKSGQEVCKKCGKVLKQ